MFLSIFIFGVFLVAPCISAASTVPGCTDKLADCSSYTDLCTNTAYKTVMSENCPVTCGLCITRRQCADTDRRCASWSANGFCNSTFYNAATKQNKCALTCNLCTTSASSHAPQCIDLYSACTSWVANGFCTDAQYSNVQRRRACPYSCGFC